MAAALLLGIAGCGGEGNEQTAEPPPPEPTELDITLDGYPGPGTVGILLAERRGYFDDLGLDVWLRTPQSRLKPVRYVAGRQVALAVSRQPQVVLAQEKGAPVVAFGSLVSQPTAAMIWLKQSRIDGIADLKGKTIAYTGLPFEEGILQSILTRAGLTLDDVELMRADYDLVDALVTGRADAILGGSWSIEGAQLEARGMEPVVTPLQDLGIPPYDELVLITRPDRLADEPQALRKFMAAVARGNAAAVEDPKAAVSVVKGSIGANPDLSRREAAAMVDATLPLLSKDGFMDPDQAGNLVGWMEEEGMVEEAPSVSDLLTNELLERRP